MEITTKVLNIDGKKEVVSSYPNTEKINIGDLYVFCFAGVWNILECYSENELFEINENGLIYQENKIDLRYDFWKSCFKIFKTTYKI